MAIKKVIGIVFFILVMVGTSSVFASMGRLLYDLRVFRGVNSIVVSEGASYNYQLRPFGGGTMSAGLKAVNEIFNSYPQLKITNVGGNDRKSNTNALYLTYAIDYSKPKDGDQDIIMGVLTYRLFRYDGQGHVQYVPITWHSAYPFVLPKALEKTSFNEQMDKIVYEGLKDLLNGLPHLVVCGSDESNKDENDYFNCLQYH